MAQRIASFLSVVCSPCLRRALQKGEFPGGVYYTDLSGVESREAAAVALALTLNAPRSVAEKDVDAAIVAALRHIGPRKLTLIVFDGAESLVESSCGGGEDLRAFISKLQSVGPQFRFLVATSHPFPFDGFGVVRVGPLPSRDLIKAYQARRRARLWAALKRRAPLPAAGTRLWDEPVAAAVAQICLCCGPPGRFARRLGVARVAQRGEGDGLAHRARAARLPPRQRRRQGALPFVC